MAAARGETPARIRGEAGTAFCAKALKFVPDAFNCDTFSRTTGVSAAGEGIAIESVGHELQRFRAESGSGFAPNPSRSFSPGGCHPAGEKVGIRLRQTQDQGYLV